MIPQSETEKLLADELAERGVLIERELEVTSFTQDEDSITTTIKRVDGNEETIQTNWLLGCDGAHSTVRHSLG